MRGRRRAPLGLRGRMVLALVATSLTTLGVAALVVLRPLEQRLEKDRLSELRDLAVTIRPAIRAVPRSDRRRRSHELVRVLDRLQARTGGRLVLYDRAGTELADTVASALPSDPTFGNPAELRAGALARPDGVLVDEHGDVAFAATVTGRPDALLLLISKPLDDSRAAAAVVRAALPLALAAGLVAALGLAYVISRGLLRRLERLQADAEALATEGLTHHVRVTGVDEVAVVAGALEDVRKRLVEEQTSRQEFVATASHELRTPLASLQATLELLQEETRRGFVDSATLSERIEVALRQTRRLTALATDLLDISRVDGGASLQTEPLEIVEVAAGIGSEFSARLHAAGRTLRIDGESTLVLADPAALARILRILLDNAANYGAGTVTITVSPARTRVVIAVEDEGSGIPEEERDRVFRRFARGSQSAAAASGAGLGLAIARGLAEAMGGELIASPTTEGARLVLTLPAG